MLGTTAQLVALTCHGNAFLQGESIPVFFPNNSTCQFDEYVSFLDADGGQVAKTPDLWFKMLKAQSYSGLKIIHENTINPQVQDRMLAGFVGGGGIWKLLTVKGDAVSNVRTPDWRVGNQDAPDRRIWRVNYRFIGQDASSQHFRSLSDVKADFEKALRDIHAFSQKRLGDGGFTSCFANGLKALNTPGYRPEYNKDLYPAATLSEVACSLLSAASVAWVFGGMGSWNDIDIDQDGDYDRVSEALYRIINEATVVAANSSWSGNFIKP